MGFVSASNMHHSSPMYRQNVYFVLILVNNELLQFRLLLLFNPLVPARQRPWI